ncbi:MAG: hypothetical protein JNK33_06120, partial [Candidatus Doudnabacteria bacterium]|nr:hypothetical protein [Candidatus Doudnabacteria bacterium]
TPASLTITANNAAKVYGDTNPTFGATYSGFVLGQDESVLSGSLGFNTPATTNSDVGNYAIAASGLSNGNYDIDYNDGNLSINPATLNITVNNASKTYGDVNPTFGTAYSGFVLGQNESVLSGSLGYNTPATASSNVGNYSVSASGLNSNNYSIHYNDGNLAITPATLNITANNASKTYGDANPSFTSSYSGFVLGQNESVLSGSPGYSTSATANSDVGNYAIAASGLISSKYNINYNDGNLAITPATLNITVNNSSKVYGDVNPIFNTSYSGFVLGQNESVLSGTLGFNTSATTSSDAGNYSVSASGLNSGNYSLHYNDGNLAITPASLIITANNSTKVYGDTNPTFGASYSGFMLGQDTSVLSGTLGFNSSATSNSDVGNYSVTPTGLNSGNYNINYNSGNLSVTPASLTVTANNASINYGDNNPLFTANYSGFVLGQNESVLSGALNFSTAATNTSNIGNYAIAPSGYSSSNYTINYANGNLGISPAPLSITANNANKIQGEANPSFSAGYSGFVLGQNESSLSGTLQFNTPATTASGIGSYAITPSGLSNSNYAISYHNGTLSITPPPPSVPLAGPNIPVLTSAVGNTAVSISPQFVSNSPAASSGPMVNM